MSQANEHIVKSFDSQLEDLRHAIVKMGGLAESQVAASIKTLVQRDVEAATTLLARDRELDRMEHEIDKMAMRLLALRQPVAIDLREIVSALKISNNLERIGDYACSVAERARTLARHSVIAPVHSLPRMAQLVQLEIKTVLDAYVKHDAEKAIEVWNSDEEVDALYTSLFRETLTYMMEDPRNITPCTHLLFIARSIERMGDHATNMAEYVYYLVKGEPLTFDRPVADSTSLAGIDPPQSET